MTPLRALIVDDEPLARDTLRLLLDEHADIDVVGDCADGRQAVEAIRTAAPDLVFLDVQMPELDGFGVVQAIGPEHMPVVLFVTAYDQYALRAFEAQALDYLLKPFDDERFAQAVRRAVQHVRQRSVGALSQQLKGLLEGLGRVASAPARPSYAERIVVRTNTSVVFVPTADIRWVEAAGDYVILHTDGHKHLLRETMTGLLDQLDPALFARIHRSSIVNLDYIRELQPLYHGDYLVVLHDGAELRLSRRYWDAFEAKLGT